MLGIQTHTELDPGPVQSISRNVCKGGGFVLDGSTPSSKEISLFNLDFYTIVLIYFIERIIFTLY